RSSSARSTVVRENSAATNTPQASESRIAARRRSTSVIGSPLSHGRTGRERTRGVADREARPWVDAHNLSWRTGWPSKGKGSAKDGRRAVDQPVRGFTQRRRRSSGAYPAAPHA